MDELLLQYGNITEFVRKGTDAETNPDAQNLQLIETISKEFSETWISKLNTLRTECESRLGKSQTTKKILKTLINSVLEVYTSFFNCVKSSYPSFTQNMLPLHKLSLETKNQISSLE